MSRAERSWSEWALVAAGALMMPLGVQALGLGEARVESFLNQPLEVRMRLLDASRDDLDSLTVAPGSPEDYERLGLMSESLGLNLEVRVDRSVSPPVVHVTSDRVVSDPVVQLLIDARWANGRLMREYTLFLDPATTAVKAPAPASARIGRPAPAEPAAEPEPESKSARTPPRSSASVDDRATDARPRVAAGSDTREYGPVRSGETLWSIARANLPSGDVTMNQMMVAIVELNPHAFQNQNINRLLRGAELRLPDAERAMALDAAAAAAEVAAQNRAFRNASATDVPVVSSAGRDQATVAEDATSVDAPARASGETESAETSADHRLSLVPPGEEESGSGVSVAEASEIAELRQRLARAEEELYAARQEAEEFQSRVEKLESLVRDNAAGLGIRDAELAGLEETLRAAREATREDADPALRSRVSEQLDAYLEEHTDAAEDADTDASGASEASVAAADSDAGDTAEASAQQPQAPAERTVTRIESSGGLLDNPVLLLVVGLVIVLVVLAAVWVALRRRASVETAPPRAPAADASPKPAPAPETPLDRARARVESRPGDLAAHLGLLQTLATEGNEVRFGEALEEMFQHVESGDEPEWREAVELAGRVVPEHPLVEGSSDWMAGADEHASSQPASEIDEDSEVDDLMSRLDSDLDEPDDSDWLDEDNDEPPAPAGPLLRDDDAQQPGVPADSADEAAPVGGDETRAGAEDQEPVDEEPVDLAEFDESGDEVSGPADAASDGDDASDTSDDIDDLVLDWDDEEEAPGSTETTADAPGEVSRDEPIEEKPEEKPEEEPVSPGDEPEDAEDDIFAQSDDDIDVKLDLAKAYLSWNSTDSARTLLEEVVREGNQAQREEARKLLDEAGDGGED